MHLPEEACIFALLLYLQKGPRGDPAVELIFTSVSVSGDSHTEAMYEFADKVEELSGGSVTCKCYDNGSLFSSENEFDALLNGDADLAYISFPTIATQIPSYSMFASGYSILEAV